MLSAESLWILFPEVWEINSKEEEWQMRSKSSREEESRFFLDWQGKDLIKVKVIHCNKVMFGFVLLTNAEESVHCDCGKVCQKKKFYLTSQKNIVANDELKTHLLQTSSFDFHLNKVCSE